MMVVTGEASNDRRGSWPRGFVTPQAQACRVPSLRSAFAAHGGCMTQPAWLSWRHPALIFALNISPRAHQ
jgi:hypothetical protein